MMKSFFAKIPVIPVKLQTKQVSGTDLVKIEIRLKYVVFIFSCNEGTCPGGGVITGFGAQVNPILESQQHS